MNVAEVIFVVVFVLMGVFFVVWQIFSRKMFGSFEAKYPDQYREIGEPSFSGSPSQARSALIFLIRGDAKALEDEQIQKWAKALFWVIVFYTALFLVGIFLVFIFLVDYNAIFSFS